MRRRKRTFKLFLILLCAQLGIAYAQPPDVPAKYRRFFAHYVDRRSLMDKMLNSIAVEPHEVGRSFALLVGVASYPNLPEASRDLRAAAEDLRKLESYLKTCEFFDEIVVLRDQHMDMEALTYFLQEYFPQRLKSFPKSRFLMAYSGHGFHDEASGNSYLLTSKATSLQDRGNSINLRNLRILTDEVVQAGHHVLVLLNACYSGAFLTRSLGGERFVSQQRGAHAITAGGSAERTWHDPLVGSGSVFFEKLFAGLDGPADSLPKRQSGPSGDGIVTVDELVAYLRQEVPPSTDMKQNPQAGDISRDGSLGGFFFLNRRRQVEQGAIRAWNPAQAKAFGADGETPANSGASVSLSGAVPTATRLNPKDGLSYASIPPGTFQMGCSPLDGDCEEDEKPPHKVTLTQSFWIGQTEVTVGAYKKFARSISRTMPSFPPRSNPGWEDSSQPIVYVNWDEAVAFCGWAGGRLPTEAEWEYAARGGKEESLYGPLDEIAWHQRNSGTVRLEEEDLVMGGYALDALVRRNGNGIHPVGQKRSNEYGLYDMLGNVYEWVNDWYDGKYFGSSAEANPPGPKEGKKRLARGGSWASLWGYMRVSRRSSHSVTSSDTSTGFRCVWASGAASPSRDGLRP